jgi:PAS domain S-box-containing protein
MRTNPMASDHPYTVLVLEDDPGIAELERLQLVRAGFSVLIASTADEGLDCLRQHTIHLVLLDYRLPGDVDGLDFHQQMKQAGFDLPVIVVTGFSNESLAIRALRAGVRDFVTKSPEYLDYLPEAVNRVLDQVRTERRLAETEARLTSVIDSAKDAILITDAGHRITLFNRAAEAMFRCRANQAIGQPATRFISRAFHAVPSPETGQPQLPEGELTHLVHYGNRGVRADGTEFPLEASLSRTRVDGRKFYTLIVRDITSRKQAEEKLAEQRNLLRTLIDALPDVVFTKDTAGRFAVCNPATLHLSGCTREEEMVGKTVFDFHPRELAERYHADDLQVLAGQPVYNREEPCVDNAGQERWYLTVKVPLRDPGGAIIGLVGISRDITERKRAEEALAERARLARLSADVGLALTTTETLQETLQSCADALVDNLQGAFARIWTFNDAENVLELQASAGSDTLKGLHSRVPLGKCLIGLIAQEHKPHLTNDLWTDPCLSDPDWARREGLVAFAGYPLLLENRLLGVMAIYARQPIGQSSLDAMVGVGIQIALRIQRKHIEEARDLFRGVIDRSNDAIEVVDPATGRFLDGNEKAWQSRGYSRAEFLNLGVPDIDPQVVAISWSARVAELRRSGSLILEAENRRKDGSLFPVEINTKIVRLHHDYVVAVVRDITERKRAERLTFAQHAVTRILASSPSLFSAITQILQALCQSLEYSRGELWHVDSSAAVLRCAVTWQESSASIEELTRVSKEVTFPSGVGLPGRVWASCQALWIPDVAQDPTFRRTKAVLQAGLRGAIGFPLTLGQETLGVLTFFSKQMTRPDEDLMTMMTGVGSQIGQFLERKRTEEDLRISEERFRQVAENMREVFWLADPIHHKILYVSPAYEAVWGRKCQNLYHSPDEWLDGIHPAYRERVRAASMMRSPIVETYDEVYLVLRPDGSQRWIHDRGFPVRNDAGEVYRYAGVAEDITERRLAEAASLAHQQQLEGIVNSAMDGIITIDEDQRILLINPAAERMFSTRAKVVVGQRVDRFIPERYRAQHADFVREFGRTGVAARTMGGSGPISGLRADGVEFPLEASISQIEVEGRKLFTVTCHDITERVRAAQTKRDLETQLHQSQKMEAFGQLAGGVAHDFNNLLTIISGYSDLVLTMLPVNDSNRESILAISEAGERAASLTRQLLAFSRQTVLEPKVLDLNAVIRETQKMLRRLIGEDILLTSVLDPTIRQVKVDEGLVGQVLMNLAVNARDAMPQGGKVTIQTANIDLDASFAHPTSELRPGWHVLLTVSDTGCGMPPEVQTRIFEPFFTTKGVGKGTGLGLAVVHGIVSQSGGHIAVQSEPGKGTTFKIYFPAVEELGSVRQGVVAGQNLRGSEVILLVEDEDGVRGLASLVLRSYGYRVLVAQNGKEALQVAATHQGDIDLLLTDVVMPHLGGRELANALVPRFPRMKVLCMSGYTDDAVVRHGLVQGQVPFLQKPTMPVTLVTKVRSVLDSSR